MENSIGDKLKMLRGEKTLEKVSIDTGIGVSTLSNYEQNLRVPRDQNKKMLADYYNTTVDNIFFS